MSHEFLLISSHPDDPAFLAEVAGAVDAKVETAPDPMDALELLGKRNFAGIFLDVSNLRDLKDFEMGVQKQFGLLGDHIQASRFHFISDVPLGEKRDVIQSPFFGSFFQRPPSDQTEVAGKFYGRMMQANQGYGSKVLENFLGPDGGVQSLWLDRSSQKQEATEAVRQYMFQGKVPVRIANTIANVVDELLMNALFDAPVDEFGRALYSLTSRDADRVLSEEERVELRVGFDGYYLGLMVNDQFGTLDRNRLLNHVSINYRDKEYKPRQGGAGAGLGLGTILATGGSLSYHCEEGKRTTAVLTTRVTESYRDFKSQFRFFSARFYG